MSTKEAFDKVPVTASSFGSFVKIKVGPAGTEFGVHKPLICGASRFFKAAFMGAFREAREETMTLREQNAAMFERFLLWLYTGKVYGGHEDTKDLAWDVCFDLYIFSGTHNVTKLQNYMADFLVDKRDREHEIPIGQIQRLYENTPAKDPLRRLCVDWCLHDFLDEDVPSVSATEGIHFPEEFLLQLVWAQHELLKRTKAKKVKKFRKIRDSYHVAKPEYRRR